MPTSAPAVCAYTVYHGCVVLKSDCLNDLASKYLGSVPLCAQKEREDVRGTSFHVTVITKAELSNAGLNPVEVIVSNEDHQECSCISLGLGSVTKDSNKCWYLVILCVEANLLRNKLGLPPKDLHCTIGFLKEDIHGLNKGISTILNDSQKDIQSIKESYLTLLHIISSAKKYSYPSHMIDYNIVISLWQDISENTNNNTIKITENIIFRYAYFILFQFHKYDYTLSLAHELIEKYSIEGIYLYYLIINHQYNHHHTNQEYNQILRHIIINKNNLNNIWHHSLPDYNSQDSLSSSLSLSSLKNFSTTLSSRRRICETVLNQHVTCARFDKNINIYRFHSLASSNHTWNRNNNNNNSNNNINNNNNNNINNQNNQINTCSIQNYEYKLQMHTLPRNFGWIEANQLCAGAIPSHIDTIYALHTIGVTDTISLIETSQYNDMRVKWSFSLQETGITCHHMHVEDRCAMSLLQLEQICDIIDHVIRSSSITNKHINIIRNNNNKDMCDNNNNTQEHSVQQSSTASAASTARTHRVVYVHCHGGVGRTALALSAYRIHSLREEGVGGPSEVVNQFLRSQCGRTVKLTTVQETRLEEWWRYVQIQTSNKRDLKSCDVITTEECSESQVSSKQSTLNNKTIKSEELVTRSLPAIIILTGLPGSGKTTLATAIVKAYSDVCDSEGQPMVVRVNRDEMRGKGQLDTVARQAIDRGAVVIVDNCNTTAAARETWISRVQRLDRKGKQGHGLIVEARVVGVYLDTDVTECRYRVQHRVAHPNLSGAGAVAVVDREAEKFMAPMKSEGYSELITLSSVWEVDELLERWGVPPISVSPLHPDSHLVKFPRTCHLRDIGSVTRDDKLLDARLVRDLIESGKPVYVEEKVDGANMGISITLDGTIQVQNRSHVIDSNYHPQFKPLDKWLARHSADLWEILEPGRHILYGEWLFAVHSVEYDKLPDIFLAFDLFDRVTETFLSRDLLETLLSPTSIYIVPLITKKVFLHIDEILAMTDGSSSYNNEKREGIYLRQCEDGILKIRAKMVRSDFIAGMQEKRWNHSTIRNNKITYI